MTATPITTATINLDHLAHNMELLQSLVGDRPMWPAIKANAYGHDAEIVARHLIDLGYTTLCVAHPGEALNLLETGLHARFVLLSASLPEYAEDIVANRMEPAICTQEMAEALSIQADMQGITVNVHIMVDTGMGRIGIQPDQASEFIDLCKSLPGLHVRGLMSHFPRADEAEKYYSIEQTKKFRALAELAKDGSIEVFHMANSAAIFDLPDSYFDAVRPGIAIYGLAPSPEITNPRVAELKPVLEWKSRITFLKNVPPGTGLSYGHAFHTERPSLIATVPVGYGDGLERRLSNNMDMLVHATRCPQIGRITMDQTLIDVTDIGDRVELGDEVVLIGCQNNQTLKADEMANKLDTINYEIVTGIAARVRRVAINQSKG